MRSIKILGMMLVLAVSGCVELPCVPCQRHSQNSTSLVEFLYPKGTSPPLEDTQPQLHLPLRVGLAFLPSTGAETTDGLDAAHKEAVLAQIRQRFISRKFVADIVVIPDYYLRGRTGFEGLQGVQRLYGIDLMALVSYDQVEHEDQNDWSLGYVTIVGAYVLKGTRHDVSTLVDLAVVDPATRSLVLRAGGTDTRHGNTTFVKENVELRDAEKSGFDAAASQMIDHFDAALTKFEADVHEGKANVKVVSNRGGPSGGGGSLDWVTLIALLMLAARRGLMTRASSTPRRPGR